mmetsp:Transcript_18775/g.27164  ORF Transcript_18775/g.27164 Transcript_18775/m.27164 type:complete len:119 (-) Transcript_18775:236-592(-)
MQNGTTIIPMLRSLHHREYYQAGIATHLVNMKWHNNIPNATTASSILMGKLISTVITINGIISAAIQKISWGTLPKKKLRKIHVDKYTKRPPSYVLVKSTDLPSLSGQNDLIVYSCLP